LRDKDDRERERKREKTRTKKSPVKWTQLPVHCWQNPCISEQVGREEATTTKPKFLKSKLGAREKKIEP
jgi:hypothetical protein